MKFDKRFNIKKFITVSAVALAMIGGGSIASTINANNNVHADDIENGIDYTAAVKGADEASAKNQKSYDAWQAKLKAQDEPNRKKDALSDMQQHFYIDPDLAHDPVVTNYLESKGYSAKQIRDNIDTPEKDEKDEEESAEAVDKSNRDAMNATNDYKTSGKPVTRHILEKSSKRNASKSKFAKHHYTKRNKSIVRTSKITNDKQAINNDKKQLSTRKAKRAMNNYKHNHKATRYIKHLIQINKDLTKREKNLALTAKLSRKTRSTRRNSHRSLKRVRKNKKNTKRNRRNKRNHKQINKHTHKRMKHNNHKNHKNRK